ncbi:hypothetical protein [Flavobacterium sp. ASW18X]|nr:hypothetical protein [Flavobacterium sp. ASW18X]
MLKSIIYGVAFLTALAIASHYLNEEKTIRVEAKIVSAEVHR